MKRINAIIFALLAVFMTASAQMANPVHGSASLKMLKGNEAEIVFTMSIDEGWHVYSVDMGDSGPISATFNAVKMDGVQIVGKLTPRGKEIKQHDAMFGMVLRFFEGSATFVQKVKFTKADYNIDCYLEYGACNDEACMPPSEIALKKSGKAPAFEEAAAPKETADKAVEENAAEQQEVAAVAQADSTVADTAVVAAAVADGGDLWTPVIDELKMLE